MASFCSTKNLSDNDISNLADFMGHAEAVHRTYYRINPLTNQVGKTSVLLDSALGNETPRDSEDDNTDDSQDDFDEYESDSGTEAVIPLKASRRPSKKNKSKRVPNKRKTTKKGNAKPKEATRCKKSVTTAQNKRKRNTQEDTGKKKRKMN